MNMKKKSLVAGLLAVSLAAQPVAATIAPKAVYAQGGGVEENDLGTMDGMVAEIQAIVKKYREEGNVASGKIKAADEAFNKFSEAKQAIIKSDVDQTDKSTFAVYELIVKEWKESTEVDEAAKKVALEYGKKLRLAATVTIKEENPKQTISFDEKKIDSLYQEYRLLSEAVRNELNKLKLNGKGEEAEEGTTGKDLKEQLINDLKDRFIAGDATLENVTDLADIQKFIDDFNSEENFSKYDSDVLDKKLATDLAAGDNIKTRTEALAKIYVPVYENKFAALKEDGKVIKASVEEYEAVLEEAKKLPAIILGAKDPVGFNYKTDEKDKPVETTPLKDEYATLKLSAKEDELKKLKEGVLKEEKKIKEVIATGSKTKALAELTRIEDLNKKTRGEATNPDYAPGVYKSIDKDLIAKLNAIVEGKPVAPVKETYYSLGVNVRDLEDNIVTRLDRGTEIPEAVREGNKIKFVLEGKEVTAHIKFVTTEKPLDVFYSKGGNVRETPEVKGLKLGYLPVNKIVLGEVVEGKEAWVEIDYNGKKAYIAKNRLADKAIEEKYVSVGARVRDLNGKEIGYLKSGVEITGTANGNNIEFTYEGQKAVVHKLFVNKK